MVIPHMASERSGSSALLPSISHPQGVPSPTVPYIDIPMARVSSVKCSSRQLILPIPYSNANPIPESFYKYILIPHLSHPPINLFITYRIPPYPL